MMIPCVLAPSREGDRKRHDETPAERAPHRRSTGGMQCSGSDRQSFFTRPTARHRPSWVLVDRSGEHPDRLPKGHGDGRGDGGCDVYLSRDGVPVVIHDSKLKRTTGVSGSVHEKTASELGRLDAGSWKSKEFRGERIPTLVDLLRLVKGHLRLVIEIKQPGMETEVIKAIREAGVDPDAVMIFSFDHDTVLNIARLEPLLPTTWLVGKLPDDDDGRRRVLREALGARASAIGLPKDRVFPDFVRRAHECGLLVFVWTVNEVKDMESLLDVGVDAIITDRPDVAIELLKSPQRT